jgi:hypothetical protein
MACCRVKVGRRLVFMRLPPGRVNGHHPCGPFTRVVTADLWPPATIWVETGLERVSLRGSEQAELASAGDRGSAVLDAQFAVQRALVGLHGVQRDIEPLADLTA